MIVTRRLQCHNSGNIRRRSLGQMLFVALWVTSADKSPAAAEAALRTLVT